MTLCRLAFFLEPLKSRQHPGSRYRFRLSSVLHPSSDELLYKLLSGVHSAVTQDCQEVADHQTFAKGDPQHLVFSQAQPLPDPFDVGLMPQQDGACLLSLLGFLSHRPIMPPSRPAQVASDATRHRATEL